MIKLKNTILKSAANVSYLKGLLRLTQFDVNSILRKATLAGASNEVDSNYWLGPELWDLNSDYIADSKSNFALIITQLKRMHSWPWVATGGSNSSYHGEMYLNWATARPEFIVNARYTTNQSLTTIPTPLIDGETAIFTAQDNVVENGVWLVKDGQLVRHPSWLPDQNYNRSELLVKVSASAGSGANSTWETWPIFIDGFLHEIVVTSEVLTFASNPTRSRYVRMGKTTTTRLFYVDMVNAYESAVNTLNPLLDNITTSISSLKSSQSNDTTIARCNTVLTNITSLLTSLNSTFNTAFENLYLFYQLLPSASNLENDLLEIEAKSGWINLNLPSELLLNRQAVQKLYNPNYNPLTGGGVSSRLNSFSIGDLVKVIQERNAIEVYKQRVGWIFAEKNSEEYARSIERELHVRSEGAAVQSNIEAINSTTEAIIGDIIKTLDDPIAGDDISVPPPGKL